MGEGTISVVGIRKIAVGKKHSSNTKFFATIPKILLYYYGTRIVDQRYI